MIETAKSLKKRISEQLQINPELVVITLYDSTSGVHLPAEDFYKQYNPEEMQKGHCNIVGKIEVDGIAVGAFMLRDQTGCAGILVFHDLYILPDFRKKRLGTGLFEFAKAFAQHYGYGILQATDLEDNKPAAKIFVSMGWKNVDTFVNPKTNNKVCLWTLKLN